MIYSRFLVSDSRRVSRSPFRWLSDLARRGSLSYPAGQGLYRGRHLAENIPPRPSRDLFVTVDLNTDEINRQVRELIERFKEVSIR